MRQVTSLLIAATAAAMLASLGSGCGWSSVTTGSYTGSPYQPGSSSGGGSYYDAGVPTSPTPEFHETVHQDKAPPPLSGGTLLVTRDGKTAIAADPDRDTVSVVDLLSHKVIGQYTLEAGDEPGRIVEDGAGRAHVALRGGGALLSIELANVGTGADKAEPLRREICPAPRGLAYEPKADEIHVACAGGELVTLKATAGAPTRIVRLEPDLRDVVVYRDSLLVSRFRSAQLLNVGPDGSLRGRYAPPDLVTGLASMVPAIAWRTIPARNGGAIMVHQLARRLINTASTGSYYSGDPCSGRVPAVATVVTSFGTGEPQMVSPPMSAVLPVDIAVSSEETFAIIAAGNGHAQDLEQLVIFATAPSDPSTKPSTTPRPCGEKDKTEQPTGQATGVAFVDANTVAVLTREPATLQLIGLGLHPVHVTIALSTTSVEDTGHAIFHSNSGAGVACASCHAEGGDDGLVWTFDSDRRRTPSLRGTLGGTEPFHWEGDLKDIPAIVGKVYVGGMSGPNLDGAQQGALRSWLYAIPRPALQMAATSDISAVERGRVLFEGSAGCTGCHSGPKLTNNQTVDIGTGGAFQVPSLLGVSARAPYLHSGCASTLTDRFGPCGGGDKHGKTSALGAGEIDDLVLYMHTL